MSYEWMKSGLASVEDTPFDALPQRPAKKEELQGLFDHVEETLDARGYFRPAEKKAKLVENLRAILTRPSFTGTEIQVLRGIVSCLDRFTRESPRGATNPNRTRNRRPKVPRDSQ
jgi:tRNA/rRNA methyltransferase